MKKKIIIRRIIQLFFIFIFFYFIRRTSSFPIPEKMPLSLFFRIDGLLALFTGISTLHFSRYFIPAAVVMLLIAIRGNFFCYWVCPFGGCIDILNGALLRRHWRWGIRIRGWLRRVRFIILTGFLLTSILASFSGIPHLLWAFDPYVIMTRSFVLRGGWLLFFAAIVVLSILLPRVWCNNICPLGALNYILGNRIRPFFKKISSNRVLERKDEET